MSERERGRKIEKEESGERRLTWLIPSSFAHTFSPFLHLTSKKTIFETERERGMGSGEARGRGGESTVDSIFYVRNYEQLPTQARLR